LTDALHLETHGPEQTMELGAALGEAAAAGDVVLLDGSFGAGKTTLVQGVARGLGVDEPVTSPSFVIANEYHGRLPLYHIDLYRVEEMDTITLETLAEYFGSDGLCIVEWPASVPADLVHDATRIELVITGEDNRALTFLTGEPHFRAVFEREAAPAPRRGT
jgi:tRNA threonylcarbamoyladenosine biosynthesis protein TsaE